MRVFYVSILALSIVLILFLVFYFQPTTEEIVANENTLTLSTPYIKISFNLSNGGQIFELHSNIDGSYDFFKRSYNYGDNLITNGTHGGITDGLKHETSWFDGGGSERDASWFKGAGSIVSWKKYSDQTNWNIAQHCKDSICFTEWQEDPKVDNTSKASYEILENSSFAIKVLISSNNTLNSGHPFINWRWVVTLPKNETYFQIKHYTTIVEILNDNWFGEATLRIVPDVSSGNAVFVNKGALVDLSGINENGDGLGVVSEGWYFDETEFGRPYPWSSDNEILFYTGRSHRLYDIYAPLPDRTSYILLHDDYGRDGNVSNDWEFTEKFYQRILGQN
jgi:hypothetical protein